MKRTVSLLLALLMLLSLSACGSSSPAKPADRGYSGYASGNFDADYEYAAEEPMAAPIPMEEADFAASGLSTSGKGSDGGDAPEESPDKIIYSSDVNVETTDFDRTIQNLDAMVKEYKGWVESSSISGANYYDSSRGRSSTRSANYTLRIPSDRFDALMSGLSALGNVPYSHTYTENVSAQYYDVQARLNACKTQEARLLEMMEVAETVEDIIRIEDRLTELRYQIESLQSTLNNWDRRVSYSTVHLNIQEVLEYTPPAEVKISYARQLWNALCDGVKSVGEFFRDFLLWFLEALPTLAVLAVLFFVLRPIWRKLRARSKEKKAARLAAKEAERQARAADKARQAQLREERRADEDEDE